MVVLILPQALTDVVDGESELLHLLYDLLIQLGVNTLYCVLIQIFLPLPISNQVLVAYLFRMDLLLLQI